MFFVTLVVFGITANAESTKGHIYLGFDGFFVANAADNWKKDTQNAVDDLVNVTGYDSAGYAITTYSGMGGRIGAEFPYQKSGINLGFSIGYVQGPSSIIKIAAASTSAGPAAATEKIKTSFFRLMFELAKTFPLGERSRFSIGGGIGAAQGRIESNSTYSGSFITVLGAPAKVTDNKTWTGMTWEINPSFIFPSGTTDLELGARYATFPKLKKSDDWSEFEWIPFGIYSAVHF